MLAVTLLPSCGDSAEKQEARRHQEARAAAEGHYNHLIGGQAALYVDGLHGSGHMSAELRSQLEDAAAQFGARLAQTAGGVVVVKATRDSLWNDSALVFLEITFADSTRETTVLPMILEEGAWRIQ